MAREYLQEAAKLDGGKLPDNGLLKEAWHAKPPAEFSPRRRPHVTRVDSEADRREMVMTYAEQDARIEADIQIHAHHILGIS